MIHTLFSSYLTFPFSGQSFDNVVRSPYHHTSRPYYRHLPSFINLGPIWPIHFGRSPDLQILHFYTLHLQILHLHILHFTLLHFSSFWGRKIRTCYMSPLYGLHHCDLLSQSPIVVFKGLSCVIYTLGEVCRFFSTILCSTFYVQHKFRSFSTTALKSQ